MDKITELKLKANEIRQEIIKMLTEAKSGHTAGSLGMSDIFTALYFEVIKHNPSKPDMPERDIVILSNGHICPVLYSTLAVAGYFNKKELTTLRKYGSKLQGHPHKGSLPGIENTSGPLGSGLSQACGVALALRLDKKPNKVFCLMSDGEHDEGNTWEAIMFASKYKLDNIISIVDRNNIQIDGFTEQIMPLEPFKQKYESFGWNVIEIDGNDISQIINACKKASIQNGKPTVIIAKTIAGKGVSFIENKYEWHGKAPNENEAKQALVELEKIKQKILIEERTGAK